METQDIAMSIGRLEGKMDLVVSDMGALKGAFQTLEAGRLSRLETKVAELVVKVGLIAAAVPIVVSITWAIIQHYYF